jgi:hypothetical protein
VESLELAVAFVNVEACEFERSMLAASLGRLDELVEVATLGPILKSSTDRRNECQRKSFIIYKGCPFHT